MKIRALRLGRFKKFDQAVVVEGFGDGLNLIAGPNETGKSTLLLALRAALFEAHKSGTKAVKSLTPHNVKGAAPQVALDFEIGGERYHLEKRFLKRPMARLETGKGRRFEDGEAEAEVKRLLGLNVSEKSPIDKDSPGHFGVMLTPQTRSFAQPDLTDATRHSLEAAIASEIDDLGNQSEIEGLLATIRQEQSVFIDGRGKPKGRYKDILSRLDLLDRGIEDVRQKQALLRQDVEALDRAIAAQDELASSESGETLSHRLAALEGQRAHAVRLQDLENRRLAARDRLRQLQSERGAIRSLLEERKRLSDEALEIDREYQTAIEVLSKAEQDLTARETALAEIGGKVEKLTRQKRHLETLAQQIERRRDVANTLTALATEVHFDLEDQALDRLTIDDQPPEWTQGTLQVTEGLNLAIEGIGRMTIQPKTEPMREALSARDQIEAMIGDLLQKLDLAEAEPEAIDDLLQTLANDLETARIERIDLEAGLAGARRDAAVAKAAAEALSQRKHRLHDRCAELAADNGDNPADRAERLEKLQSAIGEAESLFEAAENDVAAARSDIGEDAASALPPIRLEAEIKSLAARIEQRRQRLDEAAKTIVRLESAISVRAGLGLDEQIDQLERQRRLLIEERDGFALDHEALDLLQTTLNGAADEAKATFNAPLSARLAPYIQDLFPEATPLVTPDFSIRALDRNGVEEPFLQLSDGTREQIAILARIAYADMLQNQGLPALVVLDDALTFSDRDRLERVFAILEKAAERLQIIILTCHEERFAGLRAKRLDIVPATETAISAA